MDTLKELFKIRRGRYRAFYQGEDLGKLAAPPEVRAKYAAASAIVHNDYNYSREVEGEPEVSARITLRLYHIGKALKLLSQLPFSPGALELTNMGLEPAEKLIFPLSRLLPEWEFEPSFSGDHLITVKFCAKPDEAGKLFYFTGA
ncbi:MAG: hypothetical protein E7058_07835 [Lentisphaerae bacterium]|nr:hypothetical protein [Lentisphaerota bacterium]